MKYLTTIHKLENKELLLNEADGIVVGLKDFSARETSLLTIKEFKEISDYTKQNNKELYISLKPMLFNDDANSLINLFKEIKDYYYTGVIVGDLGYYYLLAPLGVNNIIYNPETLLTNIIDFNSGISIGMKGAFVAKEINLSDVIKITENKKGKLFITAHGHLNMFYSKRKLLKSYYNYVEVPYDYLNKTNLSIEELNRDYKYPIIEDKFGTHIFRENVSSVIKHLDSLKGVDYFLIDSLFKDDFYAIDIIKLFKKGYNENETSKIMNKYKEQWDDGFLNLKTIYKKDEKS